MKKQRRVMRKPRMAPAHCSYCESKTEPNFNDVSSMSRHITDRGMIIAKDRSGLCSKHQKALTKEIKQARFMGILPYIARA